MFGKSKAIGFFLGLIATCFMVLPTDELESGESEKVDSTRPRGEPAPITKIPITKTPLASQQKSIKPADPNKSEESKLQLRSPSVSIEELAIFFEQSFTATEKNVAVAELTSGESSLHQDDAEPPLLNLSEFLSDIEGAPPLSMAESSNVSSNLPNDDSRITLASDLEKSAATPQNPLRIGTPENRQPVRSERTKSSEPQVDQSKKIESNEVVAQPIASEPSPIALDLPAEEPVEGIQEMPSKTQTEEPIKTDTIDESVDEMQPDESVSSDPTGRSPSQLTTTKPRPIMVEVKPLTQDEQESPAIKLDSKKIDPKSAMEEDDSALQAARPEASQKSFIEKQPTKITSEQSSSKLNQPKPIEGPSSKTAAKGNSPTSDLTDDRLNQETLSSVEKARKQRVDQCLAYYIANPESVAVRSPWAVMHAMLPFGVEGEIMVGSKRINAIQWMCYNGTCRTQKLFTPTQRGFQPNVGGGVQGHDGQFLAMLAQSQVPASYPIVVNKQKYTVADLARYEMATCIEKSELTFKLIGLSYYIDTNQSWLTPRRQRWNMEKLVQEELAQPIMGAACGGTHRLMGLTFAVRQRKMEGRPIDGQFARAEKFVNEFIDYTWTMQNPDGSFSTNWFESRGNDPDVEQKVRTTGHVLEWLLFTLPSDELADPRVGKSVDFLLSQILDKRAYKWPIGPRGHATRAIALYQQRLHGGVPGQRHDQLAKQIQVLRIQR